MNYEAWRISYQSSEQAARAAFEECARLNLELQKRDKCSYMGPMRDCPTHGEGKDAARYRWLRERLMAADFDWQDSGGCALVFSWPKECAASGSCDATIDAAMLVTANAKAQGAGGGLIAGGSPGATG